MIHTACFSSISIKSGTETLATEEIVKVFVTLIDTRCVMYSVTGFVKRVHSPAPGIVIVGKATCDCPPAASVIDP